MSAEAPRTLRLVLPHVQLDDPHLCNDDSSSLALQGAIYDTLVTRLDALRFGPALATSWRVDDTGRRWRFQLRSGVVAHDGGPLDAEDVIATLERVRDPSLGGVLGTEGVFASYLEGASYHRHEGEDGGEVVEVELARPIADLLDLIVDFPVIPRRALDRYDRAPIGTGRYRFVRGDEQGVVLERWEHHWGGGGSYDRLEIAAERDAGARAARVAAGEADVAAGMNPTLAQQYASTPGVALMQRPASMCAVFFFNLHAAAADSPVHDPRVRQALHHATDVEVIVDQALLGYARRLSGPFTELHLAHDPSVPNASYDLARARALLSEAGYGAGCDLTVDVPTRLPDEAQQVAAMLRDQWSQVGVRLRIVAHDDRPGYAHMVRAKRIHDLCCFDSGPISSYRVLVEKFASGVQGPWWQGYASDEVDALIEQAAATVETTERRAVYQQAYRRLVEDAPWLYLYSPDKLWLVRDGVDGFAPTYHGVSAA